MMHQNLSLAPLTARERYLEIVTGLEPATFRLEGECSIQLSYTIITNNNIIRVFMETIQMCPMWDLNPRPQD